MSKNALHCQFALSPLVVLQKDSVDLCALAKTVLWLWYKTLIYFVMQCNIAAYAATRLNIATSKRNNMRTKEVTKERERTLYLVYFHLSVYAYHMKHDCLPIGWLCLQLDFVPSAAELCRLPPLKSGTLPENIVSAPTLQSFRRHFKTILLQQYFRP